MASIKVVEDQGSNAITILINGRFDFSAHKEFRAAYKDRGTNFHSYVVDMKGVEYIDSSALGMLLLLREHVKSINGKLTLMGSNADVTKIFKIANFDRIFEIK